jgi:hypothetical protein
MFQNMADNDLAERWKPLPKRGWSLSPQTVDEARAWVREGVFAPLTFALIAFWTLVGSLGIAGLLALLIPGAIILFCVVVGIVLWWKQPAWAAIGLTALSLYLCLGAALPLFSGVFNLFLLLYLGLAGLAVRTLIAAIKLPALRRQAAAEVGAPAAFG